MNAHEPFVDIMSQGYICAALWGQSHQLKT